MIRGTVLALCTGARHLGWVLRMVNCARVCHLSESGSREEPRRKENVIQEQLLMGSIFDEVIKNGRVAVLRGNVVLCMLKDPFWLVCGGRSSRALKAFVPRQA